MSTKADLISDREVNLFPASVAMPRGTRADPWAGVWNGRFDTGTKAGALTLSIGAGKTLAAAKWLRARCRRPDFRRM